MASIYEDPDLQVLDYNSIDGRPIQLDLWSYASSPDPKPAFVYFHGGGLIAGNRRSSMPQSLRIEAKARGWSYISADYRLLIPTTAKDIVDDVIKLFEYISTSIPQIDASRIAVGGSSGGAYVARLAALYAEPTPKALYSLYGMGGDVLSELYMDPPAWSAPAELALNLPMTNPTPTQAAQLRVEWDVPTRSDTDPHSATPHSTVNPLRYAFGIWIGMVTEGTVLDFITGIPGLGKKLRDSKAAKNPSAPTSSSDPATSTTTQAGGEAALIDLDLIPAEAKKLIPQLCMTSSFPPSYLVHGVLDRTVVSSESVRTYDQLRSLGVDVELVLVRDHEHNLEIGREDDPAVRAVLDGMSAFLVKHLDGN